MTDTNLCRVVIVDDEILIRQGIKHYLNWEQEGFQIVGEASNGKEALELIEQTKPHIVLTDIVMPIMDGEEMIRILKASHPEIEVIVLSSFSEFHYVRSTFQSGVADYILKPKLDPQELLAILRKTADRIPMLQLERSSECAASSIETKMDKLLSGYDTVESDGTVQEAFPYDRYWLIGVDVRRAAQPPEATASMLQELADRLLKEHPIAYRMTVTENQHWMLLLNASVRTRAVIDQLAASMASSTTSLELGWMLSSTFEDFNRLGEIYRSELQKLLGYRFFLPAQHLLSMDHLPAQAKSVGQFQLNDFADQLRRKQFGQAVDYLREHVTAMSSDYRMDIFEFKSFLSNIIFNMIVLLGNMDVDVKSLEEHKYAYFKSIEEARYADDVARQLDAFIGEAEELIAAKHQTTNPNMQLLLDYIHAHFTESLTLTEVAKVFHFNPSYLSTFFASHNPEGFNEYLNKIRVEKAIELLRDGEATISEISCMVGYSDHSYFTKVFKKRTGLSPSQYRVQQLQKQWKD
ncbi:two-component system response regulator YesN [Paenibacillus cellulosilyticus]|uniref:Two-component system response regulator YesN n=1 Tax=Paenibacillus cellulosilyticus TaxID=375489 RepID=A0A2V2YQ44_9BACL|nr:response regulator transcription factor [Paenibacillus cellulosilyticus]PWV98388.1 two-component system response regulator YesN [Paenibacillus cellulosilyticus]QKS43238.1 response regulator transcription factor [Paenibacillus cellulosilyticus]